MAALVDMVGRVERRWPGNTRLADACGHLRALLRGELDDDDFEEDEEEDEKDEEDEEDED